MKSSIAQQLSQYDYYHLGVSTGKDSVAAMLWLIYESGLSLDRVVISMCDTGNEDALTYAMLRYLSGSVFPVQVIKPERDFYELALWKRRFPSSKARFCTQHLKIIPSRRFVLDLMRDGSRVLLLSGVRWEEAHAGNNRGSVPRFGFEDGWGADIFRPIVDWKLEQCWAIAKRYLDLEATMAIVEDDAGLSAENKEAILRRILQHRIPRNPLYDIGASRVGCFPCINSRKREIRAMAKYRPEREEFIAGWEEKIGASRRSRDYSSMFHRKFVPPSHRSRLVATASGKLMLVATIHDVVRWAHTAMHKPSQYEFDPEVMYASQASTCDIGGFCE